ncbi:hypothetical protein ALP80_200213 [Pseudomonas savastanoi pv. fraxini]|nr:hypothetical protein ALP80_200213 [Pseudomonas savastanoi pv. fraxini]
MQRNGAGHRVERAEALAIELGIQLVIKQSPEQHHGFSRHVRLDLKGCALNGDACINANLASLWLASEAAELLPGTHLAQAFGGQVG